MIPPKRKLRFAWRTHWAHARDSSQDHRPGLRRICAELPHQETNSRRGTKIAFPHDRSTTFLRVDRRSLHRGLRIPWTYDLRWSAQKSQVKRGAKAKNQAKNRSFGPPPKSDFSGGMAPRCSIRLRATSSYLIGRTPTMAILSTFDSVSTFESANSPQTSELFCVFPRNSRCTKEGNPTHRRATGVDPGMGQPKNRRFNGIAANSAPD